MDDNTAYTILFLTLFGWIPILAIGSVIKGCIKAKRCTECICHKCEKAKED
ncbi:hypothetical protein [Clostridium beijerinckii]|uniref:hypothetical protein n=1 Tax=Clostridium beijerinckii TaxID=1520 RepID=UPI0013613A39|nr:hypothetical protein [Clostridium beijerinckii]MZK53476.1 hypothetical protein [Clostridium beijerinckii]MZK61614.1 hypothetical protein [Clostridium beijerinckii]MZK71839.1 hypothetical protein [Clostridium beijerinckii]MZK77243.1 hypothetical protein [Clostridium beijerinckii]MZK86322.1 hypothetical protein [Clostridium beijerinckii]